MRSACTIATLLVALAAGVPPATAEAPDPSAVGLTSIQIADPEGVRPLQVHLVYPAAPGGTVRRHGADRIRYGIDVVAEAPPAAGRHPLVLISHGLYGRWRNYAWLAHALAARGMIVASPTHPGTAWTNRNSAETAKLWQRPRDLSRIIDHLAQAPAWRAHIAEDRIAAIGHSLGGYTVMAAAGARFDTTRYRTYCEANPERGDCAWYREAGLGADAEAVASLEQPLGDRRIEAVVSYDLGFTQAFDPMSLAAIEAQVLVIGAGAHLPYLPVAVESRRLAALLPPERVRYHEIADISHFSIFERCKPGAEELLAAEGDEIICQDGGGRDRASIHAALLALIEAFLREAGIAQDKAG